MSCREQVRLRLLPTTREYLGLWYLCAGTLTLFWLCSFRDTWKREMETLRAGALALTKGFSSGVGGGRVMLNSLKRSTSSDAAYISRKSLSKKSTTWPVITVMVLRSSREELQVKLGAGGHVTEGLGGSEDGEQGRGCRENTERRTI
jgi:hypothetical protein